jgi:exosome complex RNA-binding protein Csl4
MKRKQRFATALLFALVFLASCAPSTRQILATKESQVKLRAVQTRVFDATDTDKMLRTVIATLQDLGFIVDKADHVLGAVSGTKLDQYILRMTVSVRPRGDTQLLVRANAQYNITAVENPEPYQQFFDALSKAMFLTAHPVE